MKVLFCTTEVSPFSKTGGLADFSASLPKALNSLGNKLFIVSPYYQRVKRDYGEQITYLGQRTIKFGGQEEIANYYTLSTNNLTYYFIGHEFFDRKLFYNHRDDAKRFVFLNLAILELLPLIDFYPDLIHVNDWQTALIPYFLGSDYLNNPNYENIKTLLTIHNLEKQGAFPMAVETFFNIRNYTYIHLNQVNYLKAGIMRATKINTVSKNYRSEILTKFFGFSLDGALKARQFELLGIQNGIDNTFFNPDLDQFIGFNYDIESFERGKELNKAALIREVKFSDERKIVVSFMSRFARQKGIDLIIDIMDKHLDNDDFYFFVNGEGAPEYESYFEDLALKYPNNFHYTHGHNHQLSQKIFAASDIFLMPSLFEASGLNQMTAMRYGAIPIVRSTGGLKDTVKPYNKDDNTGVGFTFDNYDSEELDETLTKAITMLINDRETWNKIIKNAMSADNGIKLMADEYNELYKEIIKE